MCVCFFFVGTSTWSAAAFTRKTSPEGETGKFPICGSGRGDYSSRAAPSDYLSSSSLIILRLNQRSHNHFFLRLEGRRVSPLHPELGGWNWINRQSRKQFESLTNLFSPLSLSSFCRRRRIRASSSTSLGDVVCAATWKMTGSISSSTSLISLTPPPFGAPNSLALFHVLRTHTIP